MRELQAVVNVIELFEHEARAHVAGEIAAAPAKDRKVWLEVLHAQTQWFVWMRDQLPHESFLPKIDGKAVYHWMAQTEPKYRNVLRATAIEFKTEKRIDALKILDRTAEVLVTLELVRANVQQRIDEADTVKKSLELLKSTNTKKEPEDVKQ